MKKLSKAEIIEVSSTALAVIQKHEITTQPHADEVVELRDFFKKCEKEATDIFEKDRVAAKAKYDEVLAQIREVKTPFTKAVKRANEMLLEWNKIESARKAAEQKKLIAEQEELNKAKTKLGEEGPLAEIFGEVDMDGETLTPPSEIAVAQAVLDQKKIGNN